MGITITQKKINSKKYIYSARWRVYKLQKIVASGKQSGFTTREEARKWGLSEFDKNSIIKHEPELYSIKALLEEWVDIRRPHLAPSTYKGYKVNINHMDQYIGKIKPIDLQYSDIQLMVNDLRTRKIKPMSAKSVSYIIRTLHAAIEYAVIKKRIMNINPAQGIEIIQDEKPFEVVLYSFELLSKMLSLLKEMNHELYAPVLLASTKGLRRGEALAMEWSQIDFDKQETQIKYSYNKVKDRADTRKVKTKKSARKISIKGILSSELKWIRETREKNGRISKWVCENDNGTRMEASHLSRYLGTFQQANGFPKCRFHDLRHTYAKLNLESGIEPIVLSQMLGHSKFSITADLYLHEDMTMFHKASDLIEDKIFTFVPKLIEAKENNHIDSVSVSCP